VNVPACAVPAGIVDLPVTVLIFGFAICKVFYLQN
jgi:hypothetical protein